MFRKARIDFISSSVLEGQEERGENQFSSLSWPSLQLHSDRARSYTSLMRLNAHLKQGRDWDIISPLFSLHVPYSSERYGVVQISGEGAGSQKTGQRSEEAVTENLDLVRVGNSKTQRAKKKIIGLRKCTGISLKTQGNISKKKSAPLVISLFWCIHTSSAQNKWGNKVHFSINLFCPVTVSRFSRWKWQSIFLKLTFLQHLEV